jgi:uncharacterized protein YjbJ (UPF0337 family)
METTRTRTVTTTSINKDSWQEKRDKLKEKYPQLTDNDLDFEEGKMDKLIDKIHSKIGKTIGKSKVGLIKFIEVL